MKVPPRLLSFDNNVCRLKKYLYGLKQALRQCFAKLSQKLHFRGYKQSKNDYSLFLKTTPAKLTILVVYVDDILITSSDPDEITNFKTHLNTVYGIKDLGFLHYFLGLEASHSSDRIILTQRKFTQDLLSDYGNASLKPVSTPLPLNLKLLPDQGEPLSDATVYRTIIGKLNFLTNTISDISYAVQTLSQFMQDPRHDHFQAIHHVLHYISGTQRQGILLKASHDLKLQAYSDSDWGACPISRRSITGYIV